MRTLFSTSAAWNAPASSTRHQISGPLVPGSPTPTPRVEPLPSRDSISRKSGVSFSTRSPSISLQNVRAAAMGLQLQHDCQQTIRMPHSALLR